MNASEIVSLVISGIGALGGITGVVALFQTRAGNTLARESNMLAEQASELAKEANVASGKANELAEEANQISQNANKIAGHSLAIQGEEIEYRWEIGLDEQDGSALRIVNDCGGDAHEVAVTVASGGHCIGSAVFDQIPAFGKAPVKLTDSLEELIERTPSARFYTIMHMPVILEVTVHILFDTPVGKRKSDRLHERIDLTDFLARKRPQD